MKKEQAEMGPHSPLSTLGTDCKSVAEDCCRRTRTGSNFVPWWSFSMVSQEGISPPSGCTES